VLKLHPSVIRKNGRKEFVVFPYDEFEQLEEVLQDAYGIRRLRQARKADKGKTSLSVAQVKKQLGL
jgi:PHD/YefM family antitoxin component YafN of YafNO toxin-antitoxin module